jgi:ATP/maltotriose-dependent transcriptional regulator MalT
VLAEQGKIDEAERFVGEAQEYLPSAEPQLRLFIVLALAAVRTAQERRDEAEELFVEALAITDVFDFTALEAEALRRIVRFLEDSGQNGKAAPYEERLAVLVPAESTAEIA